MADRAARAPFRIALLAALACAITAGAAPPPDSINGFDLSGVAVDRELIRHGGPPRDGIPALTDPDFVIADKADFVDAEDRVLGLVINDDARAYPLSILNWHEIVNDQVGGQPVVVTYCPLCFTGMAFRADGAGERRLFGVSGLLYNSDVLLYDPRTESLWSQLAGVAVSGPMEGTRLEPVPLANTSWRAWRAEHPGTRVLSVATGHRRDYDRDPYAWYDQSPEVLFPVAFRAEGLHPKEYVVGLVLDGNARAWPVSELARSTVPFEDRVGDHPVLVHYDDANVTGHVTDADGAALPSVMAYWFAWYAFHPGTGRYRAPPATTDGE